MITIQLFIWWKLGLPWMGNVIRCETLAVVLDVLCFPLLRLRLNRLHICKMAKLSGRNCHFWGIAYTHSYNHKLRLYSIQRTAVIKHLSEK